MSDFDHKVGVSEANLVLRHLKLININEVKVSAIIHDIDATFGVDAVSFENEKTTLHVGYDATHCDLDGIENIVKINGVNTPYNNTIQL